MSRVINEILGLEFTIDFTKLGADSLKKLYDYISNPTNLIGVGVRSLRNRVGTAVTEDAKLSDLLNRPLKDLLSTSGEKGGGPLGLGIINRVLKR